MEQTNRFLRFPESTGGNMGTWKVITPLLSKDLDTFLGDGARKKLGEKTEPLCWCRQLKTCWLARYRNCRCSPWVLFQLWGRGFWAWLESSTELLYDWQVSEAEKRKTWTENLRGPCFWSHPCPPANNTSISLTGVLEDTQTGVQWYGKGKGP